MKIRFPHCAKAISCFCAWLLLGGIAFAQHGYNFDWTTTQQAWITGVIKRNVMETKAPEPPKVKSKASKSLSSLTFTSVADTRSATIRHMAELLGQGDAEKTRLIEDDLKRHNVVDKFNDVLKNYKFTPSNVADVFSAYIVLTWQLYTGKDATQNIKGVYLYRDAVRQAMLKNGKIETLDKKDRQVICEKMAVFVYMVTSATNNGREAHVLEGIRKTTLDITGVDIAAYDLTDNGFSKRKSEK